MRDDAVKSLCNDAKLRGGFGVSLYEISMYVIIYKYMFVVTAVIKLKNRGCYRFYRILDCKNAGITSSVSFLCALFLSVSNTGISELLV